jgi:hypothetical protein
VLFLVYAALMGVLISDIFLSYSLVTLGAAFLVTAGTFASLSLYGFVTKRDLTGFGSICIMGLWGLILASFVNMFMASNMLDWVITYGIVFVCIGIITYRTQMLKQMALQTAGAPDLAARYAIIGSLILYVSFVNLFISILRIMGNRR